MWHLDHTGHEVHSLTANHFKDRDEMLPDALQPRALALLDHMSFSSQMLGWAEQNFL